MLLATAVLLGLNKWLILENPQLQIIKTQTIEPEEMLIPIFHLQFD